MTTRQAEIAMAVLMALASIALMVKSYGGLEIGWIPQRGPGAGAWPFWLSTGMLLTCLWTIVRWFRGITPESRSSKPFIGSTELRIVGITVISLIALLVVTEIAGIYLGIFLFLVFYLRILGAHNWMLTANLALGAPLYLFVFFEGKLNIPLPKGVSGGIAEQVFVDLGFYDLIYGRSSDPWTVAHFLALVIFAFNAATVAGMLFLWVRTFFNRQTSE